MDGWGLFWRMKVLTIWFGVDGGGRLACMGEVGSLDEYD
jgi:hypothetical protein